MRSFEDIKTMVAYVLDTKDNQLIEKYAYAIREGLKKDGEKIEIPTIQVDDKIYYGESLEVINDKFFIDGEEINTTSPVNLGGDINIIGMNKNNSVRFNGGNIFVNGDLHCHAIHKAEIRAKNITTNNIHKSSIEANNFNSQVVHKCETTNKS